MESLELLLSNLNAKKDEEKQTRKNIKESKSRMSNIYRKIRKLLIEKQKLTEGEFILSLAIKENHSNFLDKIKDLSDVEKIYSGINRENPNGYLHEKTIIEELKSYKSSQKRFTLIERTFISELVNMDLAYSEGQSITYDALLLEDFSLLNEKIRLQIKPPYLKERNLLYEPTKITIPSNMLSDIEIKDCNHNLLESMLQNIEYVKQIKRKENNDYIIYEVPKDAAKRFDEVIERMKRGN